MEEPPTSPVMLVPDPIAISSTTPGTIEISQTFDDQWVPQDVDENLTFELPEVVEISQHKDQAEEENAHARIRTEEPFKGSRESQSHDAKSKPMLFTRPASSHEDLAFGFSFTKARPAQPLNLGIKTKQVTPPAMLEIAKAPNLESCGLQAPCASPIAQGNHEENGTPRDDGQSTLEVDGKFQANASTVPFPLLLGSAAQGDSRLPAQSKVLNHPQVSITAKYQESPHLGGSALLGSGENTLVEASPIEHNAKGSNRQQVEGMQAVDLASVTVDPNVRPVNFKRKKQVTQSSRSDAKTPSWMTGQDEVIHMLMFLRQKHSQEYQRMVAIQEAQNKKITELQVVKENLTAELQHTYKRLEEKEAVSGEEKLLKTKVQAKLRKFTDFLNNLSENHSQLRDAGYRIADDTQKLRTEFEQREIDLQNTKAAMSVSQEAIKGERALWVKELLGVGCQAKLLEQKVDSLQDQLQREQAISNDERARNQQFEENVKEASNDYGQLMNVLEAHHVEISKNITQLFDRSDHPSDSNSAAIDPTSTLEKCVQLLEALRARDIVQPADLHRLEKLVKEDAKNILGSIQACESTVLGQLDVSQRMAQQMDDSLKKELQGLAGVVAAEQPRSEQVMELRERKATIQERLQATEAALRDARVDSAMLKTREEGNFHRIASLENQVSQMQVQPAAAAAIAPETLLRLHDLETHNRDLARQRSTMQMEVAALSDQLQQKNRDVEIANGQLASIQLQLEEAQAKYAAMQEQQSSLRKEVAVQCDQVTKELSQIANLERANLKRELANTQKQLEKAQSNAIVPAPQSLRETDKQIVENAKLENLLAEKTSRLQTADAELHKERKENSLLHEKITSLDQDIRGALRKQNDKDKEIAYLKGTLRQPRIFGHPMYEWPRAAFDYPETPAVEEDSQIEEIPRDEEDFAEAMSKHREDKAPQQIRPRTPKARSKLLSEEIMKRLLAPTPEGKSDVRDDSGRFLSERQLTTYQRPKNFPKMRQVEDSRSQNCKDPAFVSDDLGPQASSNMASYNSSDVPAPRGGLSLDGITAQNTVTNAQGAKSNTKIARKRSVMTADLAGLDEPGGPRKVTRSSSRINGSIVVADSQSSRPVPTQTNRPARLSTTQKKGSRAGIYQKEFDKHLHA